MDRACCLTVMKLARKLLHTRALAPSLDRDELPGPDVTTDDEWMDFARDVRIDRVSSDRYRADGARERQNLRRQR